MKRGGLIFTLALGLLAAPLAADAQRAKEVPRVGFLANVRGPATDAFEKGLRELGYIEGKNIVIEWRLAQGKFERLPELAADLARLNVAVILAPATPYVRAATKATSSIPIVFALVADPVGEGLVTSLARPGGNITGLTLIGGELVPKRLQLLKETVPGLNRVAVLYDWDPGGWRRDLEAAARGLAIQLQFLEVRDPAGFDGAFAAMLRERAQAVMVLGGPHFYPHRRQFAVKHRLPAMLNLREYAEAGGLMVYAASTYDLMRRAATYADKILRGARPADLPIEQPTKFELVINLKTAQALGLTIPPAVLLRADEVIQ